MATTRPPQSLTYVPGKPVVSRYASPNLADRIFKVRKDTRSADYQVPDKGTAFDGVRPDRLANFVFATVVPAADQPEWADWYYINERANQDDYNYEIIFPGGDHTIPQITRTYTFLREDYEEIADSSPDPIYADTVLVDRKISRSDDPIIDSLFIIVQRVFELLPGVTLTSQKLGAPDLIPEKYRRLVKDIETKQPVPANYFFPNGLSGNQVEIELAQESITKARLRILEQIVLSGDPLVGGKTDTWGDDVIYESIVDDGSPIDEGYLVKDSTVTPLGNGKSIKITVNYPAGLADVLLLEKTLGKDNLIPDKYRALVRHDIANSLVDPDTYSFPSALSGNQTAVQYAEETIHQARLKIVEEIITATASLVGHEQDKWGFLVITESIVNDGTAADDTYFVLKSSVTPLGNGKSVKITVTYPDNLASIALLTKTLGQDNLIPEKYRALVHHDISDSLVDADTYVFPTSLTGDQSQVQYIQETLHRARLQIVEEIINVGSVLVGSEQDKWGFLTIFENIVDDGTSADDNFFVVKSTVTPLGNGKSVKITVAYPANLASIALLSKTLGQDSLIPEKYRRLVVHNIADSMVDVDTYSFPGGLTGDQSQIEYIQETLHRARLKIVEEVINTDESSLSGEDLDRWGILTIVESIVDDGTDADEDYLVVKSTVTPLGNGKSVKITVTYPSDLAARSMAGQEYDGTLDLVTPYVESLQPAGTGIGQPRTIVEPQTIHRELDRTPNLTTLEEILSTYLLSFPGTTNLQLPDVLDSIDSFIEHREGEGFYSETGVISVSSGSGSLDIRGSGNSSASIMPTVVAKIVQPWGHNVPTQRYMFFMDMPIANQGAVISHLNSLAGITVQPWPKFKPEGVTMICIGEALTLTTEASSKWTGGTTTARGTGTGSSRRLELTINTVRVPPTLHATLNGGGDIINESIDISCSAHAEADVTIPADITESGTVTGRAYGDILATSPETGISNITGKKLLDVKIEPWKYGKAMVHCEVVDFADVN